MPIKTFRGFLADDTVDTIVLHTRDGSQGYRIVKFQLMPEKMGGADGEHTCKIYSTPQTAADIDVNFSDSTLLAAGTISNKTTGTSYPPRTTVVFDQEVFNQDIYITHSDNVGAANCNYYIELEQIKLDLSENTVATLKDIRNLETP